MNNLVTTNAQTMSSREIAELVESRHDSVKRTIERCVEKCVFAIPPMVEYLDSLGRGGQHEYLLNKRDSLIVVAQLCPEFTARIVDRWQELEAAQVVQVPTSFAAALRLAAAQAEQIEVQAKELEAAKPAVQFLDRYVEAKSTKSLREAAKVLGIPERQFIGQLLADGILYRQSGCLLPAAEHQHAGRFEVKTGETNGHAYHQTRFTTEGIAWIAKRVMRKAA